MKNNSQIRNRGKYLTNIGFRFLLLCVFLTSHLPKILAEDGVMLLQSTYVTLNLTNVSLETLFKTLEKKSDYVFFFKEDVLQKNEKVTVKAQNESVVSILNRILPPKQLTYTVKGRQVIIVRLPRKEEKKSETPVEIKDYTVKGTVVDASGQPLPGVNITVQGTTQGVTTNLSGSFILQIKDMKRALLVASYIGFSTKKVWVSDETDFLKIVLEESSASLNEVVVVGYGTQKKLNLTGAVTTASGDILENRPIGNIAQGLQGIVPNLNITFDSGQPNEAAKINIRGNTSLNGGNALILVDGVEISDLSLINPQDVESVSVLKDASAAAVYGARAAFGVMLVTTKKGNRNQKTRVTYNNNLSWSSPARLPEMPRADVWARMWNKAYDYESPGSYYFNDRFLAALDAHIADPVNNPAILVDTEGIQNSNYTPSNPGWAYVGNTDWLDAFYKNAAFMQQHNASISGGTEKNSYYASIGYKGQDGLFAFGDDTYKRINMSFNFTSQLTNWLEITFRTKYNRNESDIPNTYDYMGSSPYHEVYRAFPFIPVYLPDGNFAAVAGSNFNYNIAGIMAQAGRDITSSDDFWYTGAFNITPIKGLSIKGDYTGNKFFKQQKKHQNILYQSQPDGTSIPQGSSNGVNNDKYNDTYQALNLWAEYKKTIKQHSFGVMAGYNQESKKITALKTKVSGLYDNNTPVSDLATTLQSIGEDATVWAVQGMFFRLNYDYLGRYLLEVNGRYDGSSKYKSGSQWGFFPSVSVGWRLSEEKFFEPARNLFDNVKLRASIGTLGNQVTNGNFDYLGYLDNETLSYVMGGKVISGLKAPTLASTNITWEKVTTTNFGLDIAMLNNRLNASFDYYIRNTNDMVISKTYPAVLGSSGGKENLANMRTNGWELSVSWNDKINNVGGSPLMYSIGVGLADSYSTITKFDNPEGALNNYYEGKRIGEIWGYVTDGFIQDEAEAQRMATIQGDISKTWKVGDIRYKDLDGVEGITSAKTIYNTGDQKVIGNTTPRYSFNINASASWKGFDVRVFFEGIAKRDLWIDSPVFWGFPSNSNVWQSAVNDYHVDNSWSENNTNAYYPLPSYSGRSKQTQTKYLQNGAYIRLKDLTISYTIPKAWISTVGIEQLKVFASGQNLWVGTKLFKYLDPDIVSTRQSNSKDNKLVGNLTSDGKAYPFSRTFSFGINLTF